MKQLIQNLRTGETLLEEVPAPMVKHGHVLIQTTNSLVSLGTEKMLIEFGKANLLEKARQQPERVKMVMNKIKTDGLVPTVKAVFNKLSQPIPLGYCNAGIVLAVGEGIMDIHVGDRVASNGSHAEIVCLPRNLLTKIPDNVSDQEATFTVIGSIALQGIRLLNPSLGETVVVIGLGLIGLLTAELLKINGCQVIGFDINPEKLQIARAKGIIAIDSSEGDTEKIIRELTAGYGADGVIITASSKTNDIISQAAKISRKRGKIILIGVTGLDINRADFYEKELTFQVSCSYGPGRYDPAYENKGVEYPLPYVRWTENRNFQTILQLLSSRMLDVKSYISEIVEFENFNNIYSQIGKANSIASLLIYPEKISEAKTIQYRDISYTNASGIIGIIGAGNFTKMTLLPILAGETIKYISSANGLSGTSLAKKHKIGFSTTDYQEILNDPEVDLVMITTRHNLHAKMVIESLNAGKHVFVEKPLAILEGEQEEIIDTYQETSARNVSLNVGYNRRFSPHAQKIKELTNGLPMNIIATMNAGWIDASSWVHDMQVGGGRILGEACHYMDLLIYLSGSEIEAVCMNAMGKNPETSTDNASILLKFQNGSTGVINYFANGSNAYSKERVEVHAQGRTLVLDNFRTLNGYGFKNFSKLDIRQDKGHKEQFRRLIGAVKSGSSPIIPFSEIINTSKAAFAALQSLKENRWIFI